MTSTFLHVDVWHIGFNMLVLWFLGPQLELAIGRARFLALYLISGLAGSACVYWLSGEQTSTLGASGAVYGLMAALLVIAFKVGGQVQTILMWIGINVVFTFAVRLLLAGPPRRLRRAVPRSWRCWSTPRASAVRRSRSPAWC